MEDETGAVWQAWPPRPLDDDQPSDWEREQARLMLAEVRGVDGWLLRLLATFKRWRSW